MRRGRRGQPTNDGPVAPARSCSGYEPRAPARRRRYLTVSRPPIRATEQPRKHTRAYAHTHTAPALSLVRSLCIATGHVSGRTAAVTTIIIYYRVLFYRLAAVPRRTRLRSRLRSSARSARVYSLAPEPATTADTRPWALPSGKLLSRHDVVSIVIATLTRRKHCVRCAPL